MHACVFIRADSHRFNDLESSVSARTLADRDPSGSGPERGYPDKHWTKRLPSPRADFATAGPSAPIRDATAPKCGQFYTDSITRTKPP